MVFKSYFESEDEFVLMGTERLLSVLEWNKLKLVVALPGI